MSCLVRRLFRWVAVPVAVIATLPFTAPALAADVTVSDGRGDMWVIQEGATTADPAPQESVGDFVRTTFRHTATRVVVRSKFVDLTREGRLFRMWVDMRDQAGRRVFAKVETTPRDRNGHTQMFGGRGRDIACNITHRVDYAQNTVRVSFPRRCLSNPRTLQFRAFSEFSRQNLGFARIDNPHNERATSRAWTRPLRAS